jgi:hypothetical protein
VAWSLIGSWLQLLITWLRHFCFHRIRSFIYVFKKGRNRTLSEAGCIQVGHTCDSKVYFNIISHLRLELTSGLYPSGFATNILQALIISPSSWASYPSWLNFFHGELNLERQEIRLFRSMVIINLLKNHKLLQVSIDGRRMDFRWRYQIQSNSELPCTGIWHKRVTRTTNIQQKYKFYPFKQSTSCNFNTI